MRWKNFTTIHWKIEKMRWENSMPIKTNTMEKLHYYIVGKFLKVLNLFYGELQLLQC